MLSRATRGQSSFLLGAMVLSLFGIRLARLTLASSVSNSNLLLDQYCCLGNPALIWPHVAADSLIAIPYVAVSVALATLAHENRCEILFRGTFLTFGLCIVTCAGTHFMEVVTIWIPGYVVFAGVKTSHCLQGVSNEPIHPAVNG
jgi:hypothetical protein